MLSQCSVTHLIIKEGKIKQSSNYIAGSSHEKNHKETFAIILYTYMFTCDHSYIQPAKNNGQDIARMLQPQPAMSAIISTTLSALGFQSSGLRNVTIVNI